MLRINTNPICCVYIHTGLIISPESVKTIIGDGFEAVYCKVCAIKKILWGQTSGWKT